ncbi:hypothetical protein ACFL35_05130 [Candidatus Riflebacteria bacterium]
MLYYDWLGRLVDHFFGPQFNEQRVRLLLTRDILDECMTDIGGTTGFLGAIYEGPVWLGSGYRNNLNQLVKVLFNQWQYQRTRPPGYPSLKNDPPPYLPYLCLLCLAWTEGKEEVKVDHAFYDRLTKLYPAHGLNSQRLAGFLCFWKGLENWTKTIMKKQFGIFEVEQLGKMAHVGIPKSQVILTPRKVDRLNELFWYCDLFPYMEKEGLWRKIVEGESVVTQVLGGAIFSEIKNMTPIGASALAIISDYLKDWDGHFQPPISKGSGRPTLVRQIGPELSSFLLRLSLFPIENNTRWLVRFALLDEEDCGLLVLRTQKGQIDLKTRQIDSRLSVLQEAKDGAEFDALPFLQDETMGQSIPGTMSDDTIGLKEVTLHFPKIPLRTFRWHNQRLMVETDILPAEGAVYILVSPCTLEMFESWKYIHGVSDLNFEGIPQEGLPEGWKLFYLSNLEAMEDEARKCFPDGRERGTHRRPGLVRLVGGSRVFAGVARKTFLPYDPPDIILDAVGNVTWETNGATLVEETEEFPIHQEELDATNRVFNVDVDEGATVVSGDFFREGEKIGHFRFGVQQETLDLTIHQGNYYVCPKGHKTESPDGARGVEVPLSSKDWAYEEGQFPGDIPCTQYPHDEACLKFLETLALGREKITFAEFKRKAIRISSLDSRESLNLNREIIWLSNLGYLEIETDSRGRWCFVHKNPFYLYPLPWLRNGQYQVVVTGCAKMSTWERLFKAIMDNDCGLEVMKNEGCCIVPPRVLLLHQEKYIFQKVAHDCGASWLHSPPAFDYANWTSGLAKWATGLSWFEGSGPEPDMEYSPVQFRTVEGAKIGLGQYRLLSMQDRQTQRHRWHTIVDREYPGGQGTRHAFAMGSAWARWRVHVSAMHHLMKSVGLHTGPVNVPYEPNGGNLVLPRELVLPNLLARTLALCSGLVPSRTNKKYPAFMEPICKSHGFTPGPEYTGDCWSYPQVPRQIAELVLTKVCSSPVQFNTP